MNHQMLLILEQNWATMEGTILRGGRNNGWKMMRTLLDLSGQRTKARWNC